MASDTTSTKQPSIASLTGGINFLTQATQQWGVGVSGASEALQDPIQALRDYVSQMKRTVAMLQTSISQVETTVALLETANAHRMRVLFDEPMDELRRNITAIRDEYQRTLKEDFVLPSAQTRVVPERIAPLCVLFETYAWVNGERMRVPPDVVEGIVPMVGRRKPVFYRFVSDFSAIDPHHMQIQGRTKCYDLARISEADLSAILRAHHWCVIPGPHPGSPARVAGTAHFYDDDAGAEHCLLFGWVEGDRQLHVRSDPSQEPLVELIVRALIKDISRVSLKQNRRRKKGV